MTDGTGNLEREAARRVAGEGEAPSLAAADEQDVQRLVREMQDTVTALRAWRDGHSAAAPRAKRRRTPAWSRWWMVGLAASAAAALVAVLIGRPQKMGPPGRESEVAESWRADAARLVLDFPERPAPAEDVQSVAVRLGRPGEIKSGAPGVGGNGQDTGTGDDDAAISAFVGQFAFSFRVPGELPANWRFKRAEPRGTEGATLIYARDGHYLELCLRRSLGDDVPFATQDRAGGRIVIGRKNNVAIAIRGGVAAPGTWNKIAEELTRKE